MKKAIILAGLLLAMAHTAFAEQRGVLMQFHRKSSPSTNTSVNRAPTRLPIEVVYDSDTHKIEVIGDENMDVPIYLYDENGNILNYSPSINTVLDIPNGYSGLISINIEGENWIITGKITI